MTEFWQQENLHFFAFCVCMCVCVDVFPFEATRFQYPAKFSKDKVGCEKPELQRL